VGVTLKLMNINPEQLPVIGIETEITCLVTLPGDLVFENIGSCHGADRYNDLPADTPCSNAFEKVLTKDILATSLGNIGIKSTDEGMLSNGGRMYIDPSGLEYATPETLTAEEAVHRVFDGDRIAYLLMRDLQERGLVDSFQLNRRAVDHNGTSRGVHTNLTVDTYFNPEITGYESLVSLAVAKGSMFGSGGLIVNYDGNTVFHHSPRLSITDSITSTGSYGYKPLIRTGINLDTDCGRMHFVTEDALSFAWPMRASIVINKALTQLIGVELDQDIPKVNYPVIAATIVGEHGMDCSIEVINKNGILKQFNPLDILTFIAETALNADDDKIELDKETTQVLKEIISIADMMKIDKFSVAGHVESVARLGAMQRRMDKLKIGINSEALCKFDYYWDMIGGGLAQILREDKKQSWLGFDKPFSLHERDRRLLSPPKNTRAKLRSDIIHLQREDTNVEWHKINIGDYTDYIGTSQTAFSDNSVVGHLLGY